MSDLAPAQGGSWSVGNEQTIAAAEMVDPDNCDPVARPQVVDPEYPRNRAWAEMRTISWTDPGTTQVSESVITYSSVTAASEDFAKHRGWLPSCASRFQWSDQPAKYAISNATLPQMTDAYAIRVAMFSPDEPASTAGSQGYVYMAVILRGNTLTVLNVSDTGSDTAKPRDPGLSAVQHDVQAAVLKLETAYVAQH